VISNHCNSWQGASRLILRDAHNLFSDHARPHPERSRIHLRPHPEERALARVSKDGRKFRCCVHPSRRLRSLSSGRASRGPGGKLLRMRSEIYVETDQTDFSYLRSSADVKNFVPSKKRFGRLNTEMNVAPSGACATWMLPPGRHTKSPAPQLPSESSSDPSSM
jgi:hypothetical protein